MKHPISTTIARLKLPENRTYLGTLWVLALPLVVQDLLNTGVNLADSFMIGSLGANAINAVNFGNQLFFLYILVVFGLCSGSSIFMGQYWGKGEVSSIHRVMGICFIASSIASVLFASLAFFAPTLFLRRFTEQPEVLSLGVQYLKVVAVSYLFTGVTMTFNIALRCIGQTKIPMVTTLIALTLNVVLNYIFIFVLGWGVLGTAIATTISRVVELAVQILVIWRLQLPIVSRLGGYFRIERAFLPIFFATAMPVFANEVLWAVGTVLYNMAYKGAGNDAQAAVNIANPIFNLFNIVGMGIGVACGIMIANLLGAGEISLAKRYARKSMKLGICVSLVMGAFLIVTAPAFLRLYEVSPEIKEATLRVITVIGIYMVFKTFNFTTIVGILRSGGDTLYCLIIDVVAVWGIAVPAAFLGVYVFKLPIYWVVALVQLEELFKFFLSGKRVLSNVWAKRLV